jgi:DNA-binding beta-propeller fold protein YncE/ABC-type Fe3+ transport system permease subunit
MDTNEFSSDSCSFVSIRGFRFLLCGIFAVCAFPVLIWVGYQILFHVFSLNLRFDAFYFRLLLRTLGFSLLAAGFATLLAMPAAIVLGRGRGVIAGLLWFFVPANLLMPSISYAYGWSQFLRLLELHPALAGFWDVTRCIGTISTWLWALPAVIVGLSLRRIDVNLQQHALLDGALWPITFRQLAMPIAAGFCCVWVLAMQEFAVYEPTGISVIATEVRMVYETGTYSSSDNPITAPMDQGFESLGLSDQNARSAGAVMTSAPMLLVVLVVGMGLLRAARGVSAADAIDAGRWPAVLNASGNFKYLACGIVILCLCVPTISMIGSLHRHKPIQEIWNTFSPMIVGSVTIAGVAGAVACCIAGLSAAFRERGLLPLAILTFLLGGQMVAISLIRVYNQAWLEWIYNAWPIVVMSDVALFGWVALAAGRASWSPAWRELRELASLDASPVDACRYVIWPLVWPMCAAAGVLVMILSLTEVPATLLLKPLRPPMLIPILMTWVHMLRYDDMIEGTLLLMGVVLLLALVGAALVFLVTQQQGKRQKDKGKSGVSLLLYFCLLPLSLCLASCNDASVPDDIWCNTGIGPGQVVYPRGIAYSAQDDTFFVVDRMARVQHLDRDGTCLNEWRMPDWKLGKPVGLTVGPDGNLYIPDTHYQRIQVYQPNGTLLREWGKPGKGPGEFIFPTDVAFDAAGNVYVSEYGDNDRIQVFNSDGMYLREFGKFGNGPGEFARPQSMLIDGNLLYVTDACNHRISVFKLDGTFVRNMGSVGSELGQFRYPYGLAEDTDGNLVVCEFGNNRVQLIDKETGKGLAIWGAAGRDEGQLAYPWGVAVDKRDRVVAVDAGNNRLQVFEF